MTDLHDQQTRGTAPVEHRRSALVWWLAGALAVALLAVIGLGAWTYAQHRGSSEQQAAMTAVTAFMDARNAHDPAAVAAATTSTIVFSGMVGGTITEGPYAGTQFTKSFTEQMGRTFHIEAVSPGVVSGTDEIAVPTHITAGDGGVDLTGIAVYRVTDVNGITKVSEIVWIPKS
ncbi:MAG TPA: nuclear transport factor 2 family protein [Candidatus Nanopelagicales bacterium]